MKRTFGYGKLSLGGVRIEANLTFRCNARCDHCNKAVGLATFEDGDMTVEQMRRAVDQLIEQKVKVTRFTFCGGEPILHRDLQEMIYEVARLPTLRLGRVLTNDMPITQHLRDRIKLPFRRKRGESGEYTEPEGRPSGRMALLFKWVKNPLDDPNDPYSGKNDPTGRYRNRVHTPFWISPADIGMKATFEQCTTRGWCGIGLDSSGWSACGKAVMFGKLLGIDPTMKEGDVMEHVDTPINDICKHCQYGLVKKQSKKIAKKHSKGEVPAISETWQEAFRQHEEQPLIQMEQL